MPSFPVKSRLEALTIIEPPPSVLVEFSVAVALSSASLPMVRFGVVMVISPGLPPLLVSTVSLLLSFRRTALGALTVIVPPFPVASVKAEMEAPWSMVSWGVSISMLPAFPAPAVWANSPLSTPLKIMLS